MRRRVGEVYREETYRLKEYKDLSYSVSCSVFVRLSNPWGVTIHCFVERGVFRLCLFTATELSSLVASFETTGNLKSTGNLEIALNLLLCGFRLFMFYWTRYHTDLEQILKKNRQNIRQNGH